MTAGIFMCKLLNILIGCFRLFCVYHMDVMVIQDFGCMSLHPVCIKYHNQAALFHGLVIAQQVHEPSPGSLHIILCQDVQFLPRIDDVVAVHQEIFFLRRLFCRPTVGACLRGIKASAAAALSRYPGFLACLIPAVGIKSPV